MVGAGGTDSGKIVILLVVEIFQISIHNET